MNQFDGHFYRFGGGFGQNIPVPKNGGVVLNNGLDIYALINMGLHFLTVIAVILLIVYFVKRFSKYPLPFTQHLDSALRLLNERYARGEIDTEDYLTRKKTLGYPG